MAENATVAIPNDVIVPIVQAKIQASIVEALGKHGDLIERAVAAALGVKVNGKGQVDQYSSYNTFTFLEATANQYMQEAAREALKDYMVQAKESLKAKVKKELEKKSNLLAAALVDGLAKGVETVYGLSITVNLQQKRD